MIILKVGNDEAKGKPPVENTEYKYAFTPSVQVGWICLESLKYLYK